MAVKSIYMCENCGFESKTFFGLCPQCKSGVGVEKAPTLQNSSSKISSKINPNTIKDKILGVSNTEESYKIVKSSGFKSLDRMLSTSGGFVENQVIALGAAPGTGKSTLCTQICDEDCLFISTEESHKQINSRFLRVNPNSKGLMMSTIDIDEILAAIESTQAKLIIIDSLNNINNGEWYTKQAQNMNVITGCLKKNNKIGIIITQVTKSGEISGMNSLLHVVDTVFHFEHTENGTIVMSCSKNRFAEVGSISVFQHGPKGLEEIDMEVEEDPEVGCSISPVRFGYKIVDIVIEALVCMANQNFGLRKASGLSQPRLSQILGVIQSNCSSINFVDKDVYIATRSGVSINDTSVDLSIANAILSSYYQTPNKLGKISGMLSLNGRIINNPDYKHIKEIIAVYRGK